MMHIRETTQELKYHYDTSTVNVYIYYNTVTDDIADGL